MMVYGVGCSSRAGLEESKVAVVVFSLPMYKFLSAELLILLIRTTACQRRIPPSSGTLYRPGFEAWMHQGTRVSARPALRPGRQRNHQLREVAEGS